jgi:hypothetical protein
MYKLNLESAKSVLLSKIQDIMDEHKNFHISYKEKVNVKHEIIVSRITNVIYYGLMPLHMILKNCCAMIVSTILNRFTLKSM